MNPFTLSCLLIVATTLPLGYFVYAQNKKHLPNQVWLFYSLALTVWGIIGMLISVTPSETLALVYWRMIMGLGIVWMPVLFYHFCYLYAPWVGQKGEKQMLIVAYIITFGFAASTVTSYFIPSVTLIFNSFYWAEPGIAFYILTVWWFALTAYSHTKLLLDSQNMQRERQNQIRYFVFASLVAYLGAFFNFAVAYGVDIYPWGNYLIVVYPFIMAYAIIKHNLFDIFIFIKQAFYSALYVGLIAGGVGGIGFLNQFLQEKFKLSPWIAPVIAGALVVYTVYLFSKDSKKADQIKREFITVAAHKLRTPLTHIRYIAEELKVPINEEERNALIVELTESNDIMINLVNRLLDAVNIETQSEKYKFTDINLVTITNNTMKAVSGIMHYKKISIGIEADANLPLAEGNERSTKFIIQSLTENALTYTQSEGEIKIKIYKEKDNLIWSIKDNGIGIAKEDLKKVFDKFYRGNNALKTDTEGTGLALFMAKNLVKRQGGYINMESQGVGKGARFWFSIPISK